jgi:hypothetical protein
MRRVARAILSLCLTGAAPVLAAEIDHQAVDCVVAGTFPRLEARFTPSDAIGRARVFFRPATASAWYSVTMQPESAGFVGVLPKPLPSLKKFIYYIEVTDSALAMSRTAEFTPAVVSGAGACKDKVVAGALSSATVALEAPVGAPALPAGFAPSGVASAASAAPVGSAASGAGMSTGLKAALIVGAGAAAAAGVAVAAGGGDGGSENGESAGSGSGGGGGGAPGGGGTAPGQNPGSGGPTALTVFFLPNLPGIDVSACAGRSLTWCCQNVTPDPSGNFNNTWSPNEPNVLRVTGSANETTFNASLACVSGSGSGSITATGGGGTYEGSWTFAGQRGNVRVTRATQ